MSSFVWHSDQNLKTISQLVSCAGCTFRAVSGFTSEFIVPVFLFLFFIYLVARIVLFLTKYGTKVVKRIPCVRDKIKRQVAKFRESLRKDFAKTAHAPTSELPLEKANVNKLMNKLESMAKEEAKLPDQGQLSGAVYNRGQEWRDILSYTYSIFLTSNPLHFDIMPKTRQMEAEVISMTLHLFHPPKGACGVTTSGGTESIIMAILANREYGRRVKGIKRPNIVVPKTAHAAFDKACFYLGVEIRKAQMNPKTLRVDLQSMESLIDKNTITLVGSVIDYPFGVFEDIESVSNLALKYETHCHVDACLGGFVIGFMAYAGYDLPPFDFKLPGVTTISCDTHKYAYGPKGMSVQMYRFQELRQAQFFCTSDWPGGLYSTLTMPGSRSGALIAATWAVMMYHGREGYVEKVKEIVRVTRSIASKIETLFGDDLELAGDSGKVCVVSFKSKNPNLNIFAIHDRLEKMGWVLSMNQFPFSIHFAITSNNCQKFDNQLIPDLHKAVESVKSSPVKECNQLSAVVYGLAEKIPDTTLTEDIIKGVLTTFLEVIPPEAIHDAQQRNQAKSKKLPGKGKGSNKKKGD